MSEFLDNIKNESKKEDVRNLLKWAKHACLNITFLKILVTNRSIELVYSDILIYPLSLLMLLALIRLFYVKTHYSSEEQAKYLLNIRNWTFKGVILIVLFAMVSFNTKSFSEIFLDDLSLYVYGLFALISIIWSVYIFKIKKYPETI